MFEPPIEHPCAQKIRQLHLPKNILRSDNRPLFLVHNLGQSGNTQLERLERILEARKIVAVILGTSGSGKTRTSAEILCKKYGFFFTGTIANRRNPGSKDLQRMIEHLQPRLKQRPSIDNDKYAIRFTKCLLMARVYILHYILNRNSITEYNWVMLQLFPQHFFPDVDDLFEDVSLKFRKVSETDLNRNIRKLINEVSRITKQVNF